MAKDRVRWIDFIRGLAIIFVVFGHTLSGGPVQTYVYSFHIPLFFLISGLVYHDRGTNFKDFTKKKARQLLIPYFIFGIISIIIYSIFGSFVAHALGRGGNHFNIINNILGLIYGNAKTGNLRYNTALWFLPCLFCTNELFYILRRILKKHHFVICYISIIASIVIEQVGEVVLPFGLETAFIMLVFFELGYVIYNERDLFRRIFKTKVVNYLCAILFIITGCVFSAVNGRVRYSVGIYTNLVLFYLSSWMGIMGYLLISYSIGNNRVIDNIGKSSLAILVLHKFPILAFQSVIPFTKDLLKANNVLVAIIVAGISIVFSMFVGHIIEKKCPIVLGKKVKKWIVDDVQVI